MQQHWSAAVKIDLRRMAALHMAVAIESVVGSRFFFHVVCVYETRMIITRFILLATI